MNPDVAELLEAGIVYCIGVLIVLFALMLL